MKNERKWKDIKGYIFLFMYGNEMTDLKSGPDPGPPVVALETPMCHLNVPRNVCHLIVTSYNLSWIKSWLVLLTWPLQTAFQPLPLLGEAWTLLNFWSVASRDAMHMKKPSNPPASLETAASVPILPPKKYLCNIMQHYPKSWYSWHTTSLVNNSNCALPPWCRDGLEAVGEAPAKNERPQSNASTTPPGCHSCLVLFL